MVLSIVLYIALLYRVPSGKPYRTDRTVRQAVKRPILITLTDADTAELDGVVERWGFKSRGAAVAYAIGALWDGAHGMSATQIALLRGEEPELRAGLRGAELVNLATMGLVTWGAWELTDAGRAKLAEVLTPGYR